MRSLNHGQETVLAWVAAGCPAREWPDYTHRSTARALQTRGLVKIRGRGATWTAELTDLGRAVLDTDDTGPVNDPASGPPGGPGRTNSPAEQNSAGGAQVTWRVLVDRLLEAEGTIRVPNPPTEVRAAYRRALAALPKAALPAGKQVGFTGRDRGDLVITLVDRPQLSEAPAPLPLPANLAAAHEAVLHLKQHPDLVTVSDGTRERALLILQAVADEADRRRHGVRDRGTEPGMELMIRDVPIAVLISEEQQKVTRVTDEDRARLKYDWQRATPMPVLDWTGRLAITLAHGQARRPTWADRKRWNLEDKLPLVLDATERWADEIITARERDAQAKLDRRRQWDEALPKARRAYLDQINRDRLDRQLDAHEKAQRLRAYAQAIEARSADVPEGNADEVAVWVAWIRGEADRLDPSRRPDDLIYIIPEKISEYEMSKYMPRGMNAYRPPD